MAVSMSTTILPRQLPKPSPLVSVPISASAARTHALFISNTSTQRFKSQSLVTPRFVHTRAPDEQHRISYHERLVLCAAAAAAGLEASVGTDAQESDIKAKNAKISVESRDEDRIQLRVDVTGEDTDKVFNLVLRNLASTAPPIPGFRRQKGGKTTKVPKDFLLNVLGEERVTKFVIQEIVSSTVADYVKKEGLLVKENKLNTTQTLEELQKMFSPGKEFGFNANLELEKETGETTSLQDSDIIDEIASLQDSDIIDVAVETEV
uniref:peptidylprolyl isomerase n=1 Tax=Kalanchoe fedtschenkoi TaxID=63787 RepID=A0A7N0TL08_KALFE